MTGSGAAFLAHLGLTALTPGMVFMWAVSFA